MCMHAPLQVLLPWFMFLSFPCRVLPFRRGRHAPVTPMSRPATIRGMAICLSYAPTEYHVSSPLLHTPPISPLPR
ncbi:hypothetical protein GGR52DRAFT_419480 [Hypoxylon sp. FL1284]|nr:hypothetical protein GGR52DRAFT_419480 [Hypoxylon sp. FL1284]